MNRLSREDSFEGRLDRTWLKLTPTGKSEFESRYGRWNSLTDEQRFSSLSSYFSYVRQQAEEERIRRIQEPYLEALEGLGNMLDVRFGQIEGRLEQMSKAGEDVRSQVQEPQARKALNPPEGLSLVGTPTGMQPVINVQTSYPLKMDCRYREKGGPKECIVVETTPEGTYGTCTTGDQVRRMQILHQWFTTAFRKAGCPSNVLVRPCEFYTTKRVKLS